MSIPRNDTLQYVSLPQVVALYLEAHDFMKTRFIRVVVEELKVSYSFSQKSIRY